MTPILRIKDDTSELISRHAAESVSVRQDFYEIFTEDIQEAGKLLALAFSGERRLFLCANGSCASVASVLANRLLCPILSDRPSLPAQLLSASCFGDGKVDPLPRSRVFSNQLEAFASDGDVLAIFSTDGTDKALVEAAKTAKDQGMFVLGITGGDGGALAKNDLLDLELRVPSIEDDIVLEVQLSLACLLAKLADYYLYTKPEILTEILEEGVSNLKEELSGD